MALSTVMPSLTRALAIVALLSLAIGCGRVTPPRTPPAADTYASAIAGDLPEAREWGDETRPERVVTARQRLRETQTARWRAKGMPPDGVAFDMLALSGGGPDGAYGAGLLTGWTESGERPTFQVVSGISVGALIAPFAFVGPDYDPVLRMIFTELGQSQVADFAPFAVLRGALGVADTNPLRETIALLVDDALIDRVAREHARGRTLLIGTTNIDAGRPVFWNMGRIAQAGQTQLFRDVLLASASIPGAFPPVSIDVETVDGPADEFHVDGGVTRSVFLLPAGLETALPDDLPFPLRVNVYVIQNNRLAPLFEPVRPRLAALATRSLSTLIRGQSRGDLLEIFLETQALGGAFNLTFVPGDFAAASTIAFDSDYMARLFAFAQADARDGIDWLRAPPQVSPSVLGSTRIAAR